MLMPRYPSYTQAWKWFISFWWFIYYESPNIESQFKCGWLSYSEVILIQYLKFRYWIRMYLHAWFVLLTNVILMLCLIWHLDWMLVVNVLPLLIPARRHLADRVLRLITPPSGQGILRLITTPSGQGVLQRARVHTHTHTHACVHTR